MFGRSKSMADKATLPPGTLVHIGDHREEQPYFSVIRYDPDRMEDITDAKPEALAALRTADHVTWIEVMGVHDVNLVQRICEPFDIHPLVMEDIVNTHQRPKVEDYGDYLFVVLKIIYFDPGDLTLCAEQISLILGRNYVISFQEGEPNPFRSLRDRLSQNRGRLRRMGADYLAYALIDAVVDGYFGTLEQVGDALEAIEEDLLSAPNQETLHQLYRLKREVLDQRRSVWPLRELVSTLLRGESGLISEHTLVYLRDVYDHSVQVIEGTEALRDNLGSMVDLYLNSVSNRMNEVMKVLTIVATMFIPLTFLAGIYGMNFDYMPELHWRYGYPMLILIMLGLLAGMVRIFRDKKWL